MANTSDSLQTFPAGTVLIRENEISRKMYIIKSGRVRVFKTYMGQRITLAILAKGETFGEFSFFDAKPRSATVEALTDVTAYVVSGDIEAQLRTLPPWVLPLLRSVFQRFREADQKLTILQSMNEFEKRHYKNDSLAQGIYQELLRFTRALKILHERDQKAFGKVGKDDLLRELDAVLGSRHLSLAAYFNTLLENDFIDQEEEKRSGNVLLRLGPLNKWLEHLQAEVDSGRYTLLSHSAVALLRRIVTAMEANDTDPEAREPVTVTYEALDIENMPLFEEAVKELESKGILRPQNVRFEINPGQIFQLYLFQNILKNFDHTIVQLD